MGGGAERSPSINDAYVYKGGDMDKGIFCLSDHWERSGVIDHAMGV